MNASLNITKIRLKSHNVCFPGVSLLGIPEYLKQIPSEALTHKLLMCYLEKLTVLVWISV